MAASEKRSSMPKPSEDTKELFASLVPDHPNVTERPMFGQRSAFVNGNMFMGIFGQDLLLRLPEQDREAVIAAGGAVFEPMAGRPMREYVLLPSAWRSKTATLRKWVARSLDHVEQMPPKAQKPKAPKPQKQPQKKRV
jgi:TfoX/Sxy family transcriptional regulator of competence genes